MPAPALLMTSFDGLVRNARYAARVLARTPSFTLTAAASLALGIALNTTMFSVVNSLLLRPLGAGGDDLVRVGRSVRGDRGFRSLSYEEFDYLREHATSFTEIAGHQLESLTLDASAGVEAISAELVAGRYFSVLRVPPRRGRAFTADEDRMPSLAAVAVISDRFWRQRFAAEPAVVGRTIRMNRHRFTIVGVAPPGFTGTFPGVDIDLWLPVGSASIAKPGGERSETSLMLIARLREGVSRNAAEAELRVLAGRMAADNPERDRERGFSVGSARGVHPFFASVLRIFLLMLMTVVGVVLLIACANVAGLLLARANTRSRELAIRLAVGASRGQVIAQLLVESFVLAALGGVAGVALSIWPLALLNGLSFISGPTGARIFLDLRLDARVLAFTASATMLTAVAFGLVPALQASRVALVPALKGPRSTGRRVRFRLRGALIVVQVCLSFVLLVAAALLFRSLRNTEHIDVGFDPNRVLIAAVDLQRLAYDHSKAQAFHGELLTRARTLPGVERAALATFVPLVESGGHPLPLRVPGVTPPPGRRQLTVRVGRVSDEYFATVRQPLIRGRDFSAEDRPAGARAGALWAGCPPQAGGCGRRVAIVNEAMARRYWPGGDPLGKRIGLGEGLAEYAIVGVARDARYASFGGDIEPFVFLPTFGAGKLYLRTTGPPGEALPSVRRLVQELDGNAVPYLRGRTLRDSMASSMSLMPVRIARVVFGIAGLIALLLAAGGLYGLVSYTLEQRLKEIGIRVAMGASRRSVFRVIVAGAVRLTAVGLVIGVGFAAGVMHLLSHFLYGLSPIDPATFGGIAGLLALVTLVAGYVAARRGLGVDPMVVLRYE
jgi:predicted permease